MEAPYVNGPAEYPFEQELEDAKNNAYAEGRKDQLEDDRELLAWAYTKLVYRSFDNMEDALNMDRIKLLFVGGLL